MESTIRNTVETLSEFFKSNNIDWNHFDIALKNIEDINIFDAKNEETILSELIHYGCFWEKGAVLKKIIEHFLSNGYDVQANNGCNGGLILSELCWIAYDENIIECVKLLLDAGAPINYKSADDDEEFAGVLGSLEWNLSGAWTPDCDYDKANTLEAYYAIIKAYEANKEYHDIDSFHNCLGKELTRVSYVGDASELNFRNEVSEFQGQIVLWFNDLPLVVSNYMVMVINPLLIRENEKNISDISSSFDSLLGAKLTEIRYLDSITNYLEFDNGYRLLFSNYGIGDRKRNGLFEIRPIENAKLEDLEISEICRAKGVTYSSDSTDYTEQILALFCKDGAYCIFPDKYKEKTYDIGILKCSEGLIKDYARKFPLSEISKIHKFTKNGRLVALRLNCPEGYLYIEADQYYDLNIMLSKEEFDVREQPLLWDNVGIHMDFSLRTFKD